MRKMRWLAIVGVLTLVAAACASIRRSFKTSVTSPLLSILSRMRFTSSCVARCASTANFPVFWSSCILASGAPTSSVRTIISDSTGSAWLIV